MKQKITWMQHLAIGLIISAGIVFQTSCKEEEQDELILISRYLYFNATQHHISITSYNSQRDSLYTILPGDTISLTENIVAGKSFNNFLIADADSVKIVFDFSRITRYRADSASPRNIIKISNYDYEYARTNDGKYVTYIHIFLFDLTEDDYDMAILQEY